MTGEPEQRWSDLEPYEMDFLEELGVSPGSVGCPPPELVRACNADVLPKNLKGSVQRHVEGCRVCQNLARDLGEVDAALSSEEQLRIRGHIFDKVHRRGRSPSRRLFWALIPALAVAVVITLVIWTHFLPKNPDRKIVSAISTPNVAVAPATIFVLEKAQVEMPVPLVMRGASENRQAYIAGLVRALDRYQAGDYTEAIKRLEPLAQKYPRAAEVPFYLGVSLLFEGRDSEAAKNLERAETLATGWLAGASRWYLAIADIRSGRPEEAVVPLQGLCDAPGEYHARACAGLKELSSSNRSTAPR